MLVFQIQFRPARINMSLDIQVFIEAVKLRPGLYDTKMEEYSDKIL